jgi:hypothetical protein
LTESVPAAIASPLTIIRQAAGLDRQASDLHEYEEALLLSYTIDFGFFDSVAVAALRSTGARVTAVGDVTVASFDPRSAPRAGREFNAAYAQCSGAFHPKLFVLASPTQARIAIGSGNATTAGWFYNHELWTVIRCNSDHGSPVATQLAGWLEELTAAVRFSAGVDDRLTSVAGLLRQANGPSAESVSSHQMVSSLTVPIIDQLPAEPVDELRVFAPFFDPEAAALTQLIERFQPASVDVVVQSDLGQLNGSAILSALGDRQGRVLNDPDERYRHGKLVEWSRDGRRWALTGSANISRAAMLRTQIGGGNCELGLICETTESLMPNGASEMAPNQIRSITATQRAAEIAHGPLLLGAHRVDGGVQIALTGALPDSSCLQYMTLDGDRWADLVVTPVDERTLSTSKPLLPGSRVRLRTSISGTITFSNTVAVAELRTTAARRIPGAGSRVPRYQLEALFSPSLLERLLGDLQDLRRDLKSLGLGGSRSATSAHDSTDDPTDGSTETESFEVKIGLPMLNFSIGTTAEHNDEAEAEGQLDDEDAEDDPDAFEVTQPDGTDPIEKLSRSTPHTRARYRRWAQRAVDQMPAFTATGRLAAARIILWLMAAGMWENDDDAACGVLTRAVRGLGTATPPPELESSTGSLAAVGLAILKRRIPMQRGTQASLELTNAIDVVAYLLAAAELNTVENYLRYLSEPMAAEYLGISMESEQVMDVAAQVLERDEIGDAIELLSEEGFDVSRPFPRVLHVRARSSRPELIALQALSYTETTDLAAAWCTTPANKWALILWRSPDFIVVNGTGEKPPLWSHFQTHLDLKVIRQGERAGSSDDRRFGMANEVRYGARTVPIELGVEMLAELGLDSPHPPRS